MATKALNYTTAEINQRLNLAGTAVQPNALSDYYTKTVVDSMVVVDLSVRYATSYASLSAALTALNADTNASAIKVGGMSIKFINSGTGKYEQWNLKASSWSTNTFDWALDVDGSNIPVDKLEVEDTQSEEQAIIYETDGGVQVGKIDANGADFVNLKRGGNQVATIDQLVVKDTSIGDTPSNSHVPTTKAVKDYVDANAMGDLPISKEFTQSEDEELEFVNDAGSQSYAKVGSYGIKSKAYLDINGNPINTGGTKKLKILAIGNSYTLDSFSYLPILAKRYGISMEVHIYYVGGMSLQQLHGYFDNTSSVGHYVFDNDLNTAWQVASNQTPAYLVALKQWDIISIQQGSEPSLDLSSFAYADDVVQDIFSNLISPCILAWNVNINRKDDSKGTNAQQAETILSNIETTVNRLGVFDLILPYGTAIFNARTNATLDALGNSTHLWGDNVHLQEGVPCYIATLANLEAICRKVYPHLSIFGDSWRPTSNEGWNIQNAQGPFIAVTDSLAYLSQVSALKANNDYFNISNV